MSDKDTTAPDTGPFELTSTQLRVQEILRTAKSQKYSLSDWYLGAIYAVRNTCNPDRFSQAGQSLRELLEKLPRIFVQSDTPESGSNLKELRSKLHARIRADKDRYRGELEGKIIDAELAGSIHFVEKYLELSQRPSRAEQIHSVMNKLDPMYYALDQDIRHEKHSKFRELWAKFEGLAHHQPIASEESFWQLLAQAESLIIDLLAPISAQDQCAIRALIPAPHPEQDDVRQLIELLKRRGANYAYFFKTVDNPSWLTHLVANGIFKNPPNVELADEGRINIPHWWPIMYLQRVAARLPEQVVTTILGLGKTDNPHILHEISSIASELADIHLSLRLKPLVKQYLQSPYRWSEEKLIINILKKWGSEPGIARKSAYDIFRDVISFQPDPKEDEKRSRRKENPESWGTSLQPMPKFDQWEYDQILKTCVPYLSEREPYQVANIMITAAANMIQMRIHQEDFDKVADNDLSEIWCRRLDKPTHDHPDHKEILIHSLTYACEQVYTRTPELIALLNETLVAQRWMIFRRLRQYLYAKHPSDQTLPWIRDQILGHTDYSKWVHHYEFQLMIRRASENLGRRLLNNEQQGRIIGSILEGPSQELFRKEMGESYSEETFRQHQRHFHLMQLRPFATLLSGEDSYYFSELDHENQRTPITDDSYSPYGEARGGFVSYRSPKSLEELKCLTDEELLAFLNAWDEEHRDEDDWFIEINVSALADVFQSLFQELIVTDAVRLSFWMANRGDIERPIYVSVMLKAMAAMVKSKQFDNLAQWFEFCAWVLTHSDQGRSEGQPDPQDKSREHPDWGSSRRAVVDFIDTCLADDTDVPVAARNDLANLLQQVCNQADWRLDHDCQILVSHDDPIAEGINNTRSRGLESLVQFGFWVRRHLRNDPVPEVVDILSRRMAGDAEIPLTRPERALLGLHFGNLCALNREWAADHSAVIFPHDNGSVWRDVFGSYIRYSRPTKAASEILLNDYKYAVENPNALAALGEDDGTLIDTLGQHLITYYIWQLFPLKGKESLLAKFYDKTNGDRKRWAQLFDHVGRLLKNSGNRLDKDITDRIVEYFQWRLESAEPIELREFTFWLEAECLDAEWRLRSYSKILDLGRGKDFGISLEVESLDKLLHDHLALAVECFVKITDTLLNAAHFHLPADHAKSIITAGLNADDVQIRNNAERARENLLRLGYSSYLEVGQGAK